MATRPLLENLSRLGQRKTLAQWHRRELDFWIEELTASFAVFGLVDDELLDRMAHYDAFRMGISLDDPEVPAARQLSEIIEGERRHQEEQAEAMKAEVDDSIEEMRREALDSAHLRVEKELDRLFGGKPPQNRNLGPTVDLWENELENAVADSRKAWERQRDEKRGELLEAIQAEINDEFDQLRNQFNAGNGNPWEFDPFDGFPHWDDDTLDDQKLDAEDNAPAAITNDVFKHLFRATAQRLHPDREPDPEKRLLRAQQMRELLQARKSGDVIAVIEAWREHVGDDSAFGPAEESQLIAALEAQVDAMALQQQEIIDQSPQHQHAYEMFWAGTRRKRNQLVERHVKNINKQRDLHIQLGREITALTRLRPMLEARYTMHQQEQREHLESLFDFS
jgi:hypothetical protein